MAGASWTESRQLTVHWELILDSRLPMKPALTWKNPVFSLRMCQCQQDMPRSAATPWCPDQKSSWLLATRSHGWWRRTARRRPRRQSWGAALFGCVGRLQSLSLCGGLSSGGLTRHVLALSRLRVTLAVSLVSFSTQREDATAAAAWRSAGQGGGPQHRACCGHSAHSGGGATCP
jgi:hypothetical protein